ncbi:MAG: nitroreductase family protein [Eubacteriales bacterium]|nr:nitroreductase family protein [Eubacteriales bacterium]
MDILQAMKQRKSVRTYSDRPLSTADRQAVQQLIDEIRDPFASGQQFRILDPKEHGLSSPVIVGKVLYVAGKCERGPMAEVAYGYVFEKMMLEMVRIGLGTVWLAGTIKRPPFETAMQLTADELLPAVTPIGYPAAKRSLRESLMRKGAKADERLPFDRLFYQGSFNQPLLQSEAGEFADILEYVRWAPSAKNSQPWRLVIDGTQIHFYEQKKAGYDRPGLGDIQKCDIGIAMAHFEAAAAAAGISGSWQAADPGMETAADTEYIISFVRGD